MADTKSQNQLTEWEREKLEFAREVFAQAKLFMEYDNQIIKDSTVFTGAIANYISKNPDFIEKFSVNTKPGLNKESGIVGADFWGDINSIIDAFGKITDIVREDKKFFAELLTNIFNW